jgi:putative transposase
MEDAGMAQKKHKPEEIVAKLRQVNVLVSLGRPVAEAVRAIGVTPFTYYRWRKEFGGLKTDQVKRLKELEKENERLREGGVGSDSGKAHPSGGRVGKLLLYSGLMGQLRIVSLHLGWAGRPCGALASLRGQLCRCLMMGSEEVGGAI